jgi:hypothetical protein
VTSQAILISHPLRIKHFPYFVWLMAIDAGWKDVGFFFPQFALDDLAMDKLNFGVAFRARCSDVLPCD